MLTILGVLSVVAFALVVSPQGRRLAYTLKAQTGKVARLVHEADPLALYQQTIDDATNELRTATKGLQDFKVRMASVKRQRDNLTDDCKELDLRIKALLAKGNEPEAQRYAQTLARKLKSLTEIEGTVTTHETAYEKARANVEACKRRIQEAKDRGKEYGARLKLAAAEAAIAEMTPSLAIENVGLSKLDEATALIEEKIDRTRARGEVLQDIGSTEEYVGQNAIEEQDGVDLLEHYKSGGSPLATKVVQIGKDSNA